MRARRPLLILTFFALSSLYRAETLSGTAFAAVDPAKEKESVRISDGLRSVTDDQWATISGEKSSERYEIAKGDTLWDVSDRLFGDAKVWPKVWEINNQSIANPHMIDPGMTLVFNSGSGVSLPSITLKDTGTSTVKSHYKVSKNDRPGAVYDERTPRLSGEWRKLPRQSWENVATDLPPNIDKDGFDSRNRIYLRKPATGVDLPNWVSCEPVTPLGRIEGSRNLANYAYVGSEVTVTGATAAVQTDITYSIIEPEGLPLSIGDRQAYSYTVLGKLKILGVQNGTHIGEIMSARGPLPRGAFIVPEIKRVERTPPVAAAKKTVGTLLSDPRTGAFMSGQNKWVYIDRGSQDGVAPGMIFRIFQNQDPKTKKPLTIGDVFVQGDVQIIQNCARFSLGNFIWSRGDVPERYSGELLTDVNDEKVRFYFNGQAAAVPDAPATAAPLEVIGPPAPEEAGLSSLDESAAADATLDAIEAPPAEPETKPAPKKQAKKGEGPDWLDQLDDQQGLRSEEEKELQQLERFDEAKATAPATSGADLPPPPPDDLPPPPPEAGPQAAAPGSGPNLTPGANSAVAPLPEASLDESTPL